MELNKEAIALIVKQITEEVLNRAKYENVQDEDVQGVVALFPSFVPSQKTAGEFLKHHFGAGIDCALFNDVEFSGAGFTKFEIKDKHDESQLMQKLAGAADIVLVTPGINLLCRIAGGDDEGFLEQAILRPLLWGRRVSVVLDFEAPKFKRNTFFEKVVDAIDALVSMGVKILAYRCSAEALSDAKKALVTEADVIEAHENGKDRIVCELGAIITPLARDKAAELKIALDC